ncbi:MAG: sulfur carrier protein [Saprospiraceae bacterium]|jgi:sulfur carrier protein
MLSIKLNGNDQEMQDDISLLKAVESLNIPQNGIAIAVNQQIITKSNWENTSLNNNDEILIIKATQGG